MSSQPFPKIPIHSRKSASEWDGSVVILWLLYQLVQWGLGEYITISINFSHLNIVFKKLEKI